MVEQHRRTVDIHNCRLIDVFVLTACFASFATPPSTLAYVCGVPAAPKPLKNNLIHSSNRNQDEKIFQLALNHDCFLYSL